MPRRAAEETTSSHARKAQKLIMENDAPSSERKSKTLLIVP
jgi:hypothetical protein